VNLEFGSIANSHGDIVFSRNGRPIAEGLICLPLDKAIMAIRHGWRWVEPDDGWIVVQRGDIGIKSRK
jgi:hypothetical protein